jgi:hypothetical protein
MSVADDEYVEHTSAPFSYPEKVAGGVLHNSINKSKKEKTLCVFYLNQFKAFISV